MNATVSESIWSWKTSHPGPFFLFFVMQIVKPSLECSTSYRPASASTRMKSTLLKFIKHFANVTSISRLFTASFAISRILFRFTAINVGRIFVEKKKERRIKRGERKNLSKAIKMRNGREKSFIDSRLRLRAAPIGTIKVV